MIEEIDEKKKLTIEEVFDAYYTPASPVLALDAVSSLDIEDKKLAELWKDSEHILEDLWDSFDKIADYLEENINE